MSSKEEYTTSGAKHYEEMRLRAEKVRQLAAQYLQGNSFGAKTRKIKKDLELDLSTQQVGSALAQSDRIENIGRKDSATWRLAKYG